MLENERERIKAIQTFPQLVKYLRDELNWPIETDDFDDLTFDYEPEELGIDAKTAAKVQEIKQLRPLVTGQPWGIFFIKFEPKRLPVVALRRILSQFVVKKRASARKAEQAAWNLNDLLFISNYGEGDSRQITFAHFARDEEACDLPILRVLGWDDADTALHIDHAHRVLKEKLRWPEDGEKPDDWRSRWSSMFTLRHREVISTAKVLSERLAKLATDIRKRVNTVLRLETEKGPMRKLHAAFKAVLIHDLSDDDFADMYAQTITYGLLTARVSRPAGLVAQNVADMVPVTNPFLRDLLSTFMTIGGRKRQIDFDEVGINDVVQTLRDTNMEAVLRDFGDKKPEEDPVIFFYEDFLNAYDAEKKVKRGVFYTPRPVVSYIVRSVHELLQMQFGLENGLADTVSWGEMARKHEGLEIPKGVTPTTPFVQILDPATGTGTFLVEVIDVIYRTLKTKWTEQGLSEAQQRTAWNNYIPKHLLPRLHGYELMMAPYAIAHMKIGLKLYETGYRFGSDERARIYLTNALEPASDIGQIEIFSEALANEAKAVNDVKRHQRFTIVIGNPPYAGISANRGEWITSLIDTYRQINGIPLEEKKIWVKNDYVKFLSFAQRLVDCTGLGVVGFITDHSYLDSPTFRGMRYSLMQSFSAISIVNLHGNSKRRERAPDGSPDENVFDITQGVAISLLLKHAKSSSTEPVRHTELWGLRETKYQTLLGGVASGMNWLTLSPRYPFFEFVHLALDAKAEYERGWRINEVFVLGSNGVQTSRDGLVIAATKSELTHRFEWIRDRETRDAEIRDRLSVEDRSFWSLSRARSKLAKDSDWKANIQPYLYRPFDHTWLFASPDFVHRLRLEVMCHLEEPNLALCVGRAGLVIQGEWNLIFCVDRPCDHNLFYRGSSLNFPLYLYTRLDRHLPDDLFVRENDKQANLAKVFVEDLAEKMDVNFVTDQRSNDDRVVKPEHVFHYSYALFHSPTYRTRYAEFLKIDFPRLPLTTNLELFRVLARLGGELIALHLMESPRLDKHTTKWVGKTPSGEIEKVTYSDETVWIDKARSEGFRNVPENVWNFHIGGYQVCEKWLKDRKGRRLSKDDTVHYHKIVVALKETIHLMREIDEEIEAHGGWPGAFVTEETPAKIRPYMGAKIITLDDVRVQREKFKTLLPLYSLKAAAGYFGSGEEVEPEGWVEASEIGKLDERMFVARAIGRSMEPTIHDGDLLAFRSAPVGSRQGKIVLAQYRGPADPETGGSFTVKKYSSEKRQDSATEWRHSKIILLATNPDYESIIIPEEWADDFRIVAEFIAVLKK